MDGITAGPELGTVIVGIDGSEPARGAALWAAAEAERRETTLRIVHAADTDGRAVYSSAESIERVRAAGRELLQETAAAVTELHPDLHVTTEFSRSAAVPSLHRAAGIHGTVVIGNRGSRRVHLADARLRRPQGRRRRHHAPRRGAGYAPGCRDGQRAGRGP
ncbi:universal stress protein [Streptomyces sp. NPDC058613]|uniref:universal stress protein n=1 Tax=unclassified Streptomyces TaxID=2593676 RepID=UPI00365B4577